VPHKYFSIDGTATYLHHWGATTLPEVTPPCEKGARLLCLHGSGGNGGQFGALGDRLARSHSPLAFDLPGHGRSGGLDSLGSVERMAEFSAELVSRLGLADLVLLGHSLGGAVALELALRQPDRVRGLVLCSSGLRFLAAGLEQMQRVAAGKERRPFPRDAYAKGTPAETMRAGFMEDLKTDPRVCAGDLAAARAWNGEGRAKELRLPTLVIRGEEEDAHLAEQSDEIVRQVAGASLVVVPGAAHMLPIEQPGALAEVLERFVEGLPS